jgi:hypothetical protein
MSREIKVERICDHKVVEDIAFIESDRRTINIIRDLAVSKSLQIKRNGFVISENSPEFGFKVLENKNSSRKKIELKKKQKSSDDFFELSYTTSLTDCPKCEGLSYYFDYAVDELGRLVLISNEEKLLQDVVKGTLTIRGTNTYYPWYGTVLDALIGGKITNIDNLKLLMAQDVEALLQNLKDLQDQQASFQEVSDEERIEQLISIDVSQPDFTNPTLVEISIIFRNRAGNIRDVRRVIDKNNQMKLYAQIQDKLKI